MFKNLGKAKLKNILHYAILFLLIIALIVIILSNTIENAKLTKVTLFSPFKGSITHTDPNYFPTLIRERTNANLVIEDVYIKNGDNIKKGDKIASVYPKAVDRRLAEIENNSLLQTELHKNDEYLYLSEIKANNYTLLAKANGQIIINNLKPDTSITVDTMLYKYLPAGVDAFKNITKSYNVIVPIDCLTQLTEDLYLVRFAVPLTGRGESGQYKVVDMQLKILDSDGTYAALDFSNYGDWKVIASSEKPISHGEKVRIES